MQPSTLTFSARRRRLLGGSALALTGVIDMLFVLPAAADGPPSQMDGLAVFDTETAHALLAVCRTLFPHEALGDAPYMECVRGIDAAAAADNAYHALIRDALRQLPPGFLAADGAAREAALAPLVGTAAFKALRAAAGRLYREQAVWPHFGYVGPAVVFGGWIGHRLLELDWLPAATRQFAADAPS